MAPNWSCSEECSTKNGEGWWWNSHPWKRVLPSYPQCLVWWCVKTNEQNSLRGTWRSTISDEPSNYCIHTDIVALLRAVVKERAKTANFLKGHGDKFHYYKKMYHPEAYLFPFARAWGGSWQDIRLQGCLDVYMNLCYLIPFFFKSFHQWWKSSTKNFVYDTSVHWIHCSSPCSEHPSYLCLFADLLAKW